MKYLLEATLALWVISLLLYRSADRPGDDFVAAFPAMVSVAVTAVVTVVYLALVFWNHRFI